MDDGTRNTKWLELIDDRADLGRSIVRLSRLAAAVHRMEQAQADGSAGRFADRLVNVAATHTEASR